jgi:hypothetical protein
MADSEPIGAASDEDHSESQSNSNEGIDVHKLADRVYQLMVGDLRLELARSGRSR